MPRSVPVADTPVMDGVKRGVDRFEFHVPQYTGRDASLTQAASALQEVLDSSDHGMSARGAEVLGELTAIAVCARDHYGEPQLKVAFVREFAELAERFLNSWMHE